MLKILIAEDDFASRKVIHSMLKPYGDCDIVVNGKEAIDAFQQAMDDGKKYDLVCLDIMMPEMDGQKALKKIREIENEKEIYGSDHVKTIMVTALKDSKNIMESFKSQCDDYLVKPIRKEKLVEQLHALGLIGEKQA